MPVVATANPKGGSGKTTLCLVLADELARNGASVAVVDADPNAIIAKWARRRREAGKVMPFEVVAGPEEGELIRIVERLGREHDFVLIDLEGTASRMTTRALARTHLVLVPFNQSPMDAELAASAVTLIDEEAEALGRPIPFRLVRSRENGAIATKSAKRIGVAIDDAELPVLPIGLVERAAYRDIFDFSATLSELDETHTSGLERARENASRLAAALVDAIREEHPA